MTKPRSADEIAAFLKASVAEEMKIPVSAVDDDKSFHFFGLDSISSIYLLEQVEATYNVSVSPLYFWDYPTIRLLSEQIFKENFGQQ